MKVRFTLFVSATVMQKEMQQKFMAMPTAHLGAVIAQLVELRSHVLSDSVRCCESSRQLLPTTRWFSCRFESYAAVHHWKHIFHADW